MEGGGEEEYIQYILHTCKPPVQENKKRYFIIEQQVAQQYSECPSNPHHSMQLK